MKAVWIIAALVCVLLGCWLFLTVQPEDRGRPIAMPETTHLSADAQHEPEPLTASERAPAAASAPVVAKTTSPAPAAAPVGTELTTPEAQALEVETPPGVIEGIVLRGREPLTTGGLVYYHKGYAAHIRQDPRAADEHDKLERTSLDAHGTFRIGGLEIGDYTLALDLGHGTEQETTVRLVEKKPGRRVVIVLGTAIVKGHVYDLDGNPVAHARVVVSAEFTRLGARNFGTARATTPDGAYAIADVPAGACWFTVVLSGEPTARGSDLMQRITIAPGEVRILDFGARVPARKWRGTLRTATGDNITGGGRLHLTVTDTRAYSEAKILNDGTFTVPLRPATYAVQVSLDSQRDRRFDFAPILMGAIDIEHDLTLTGSRIRGIVVEANTGKPVPAQFRLQIGLRLRGSATNGPNASVDENGHFVVDGVEPGEWLVSSFPLKLVEGDHALTLTKQDVEIPLRLTVKTGK